MPDTQSKAKQHFREIDVCKGLGIILVVLGHSLKQTGVTNTVFDVLLSVIYSFHMPLFFFLSGFVSAKILKFTTGRERIEYVKSRAIRLLVPYFTVGILYLPVKYLLSSFAVKAYDFSAAWKLFLGENPNTALWFLYVLFWVSALCAVCMRERTQYLWLGITAALSLCACVFGWTGRLPKYAVFFVLGLIARQSYESFRPCLQKGWPVFVSAVLFTIANVLLFKTGREVFWELTALSGIYCLLSFALLLVETGGRRERKGSVVTQTPDLKNTEKDGSKEPDSISCSDRGLQEMKRSWKGISLLEQLGEYSMDVFILSEPFQTVCRLLFWNVLHVNYLACTCLCFLAALLLPIPVSRTIVRRVKIFRLLLLGIR